MNGIEALDGPDSGRDRAPVGRRDRVWLKGAAAGGMIGLGLALLAWLLWPTKEAPKGGPAPPPRGDRYTFADLVPEPPARAPVARPAPAVRSIAPAAVAAGSAPLDIAIRGVDLGGAVAVQAPGSDILFGPPEVSADGQRLTVRATAPRSATLGEFPLVVRLPAGEAAPSLPTGDRVRVVAAVEPPAATPATPVWVPPPPVRAPPPARPLARPPESADAPDIDPVLARRLSAPLGSPGDGGGRATTAAGDPGRGSGMDLSGTKIGLARARRLADLGLTIPAGTQLPCVLDTAIQTDQAGFVSCSLGGDIYGADGTVVLLDRGSQILGEYRPQTISFGKRRVFVLWSRVRTPTGVLVDVDSPGTGALGRAGFGGWVDNHYWERVGIPVLMSAISVGIRTGVQALANDQTNGTNDYEPVGQAADQALQAVFAELARIRPTLYVNQGALVNVFVARDLDFGPVYRLVQEGG